MRTARTGAIPAALAIVLAATPALATDGYFSHGYGTHYKGMAGAGVALHLDSLAAATNPAAMAFLGYSPGIAFAAVDQLLIFAFYARKDTRTPVAVGVMAEEDRKVLERPRRLHGPSGFIFHQVS